MAAVNYRKLYSFISRNEEDCKKVLAYVSATASGNAAAIGKDATLLGLKRVKESEACTLTLKEIFLAIDAGNHTEAVAIAQRIMDGSKIPVQQGQPLNKGTGQR